ncbi:MAG: Ig-like domain-containing protein [Bacteroidales bacterium]|nr:Ig-like domain-containing protein [Bacteroidales bacterium]MBR1783185.1 Ig-like domain-containing protein [Bacteroidales bacterium]
MRQSLKKFLPLVPASLILGSLIFPWGCANTTTPPTGGPKDTIPPVLKKVEPLPATVNVPTKKTKLRFTFNEYVKIKDANAVYLSPPLEKKPKATIRGKSLEVSFESDLDSNTTYTLDLTGALADNNEGNLFPGFTLVFSTGSQIDSMCLTGQVQDCNTLMPVKGATVVLYKDHSDSAVFLKRPVAAAKTDDWGFFSIRNIQDTLYRVYAIKDENNNNMYDPESERIAFLDTLFRPTTVYNDSLYEFKKFDMKDTALCLARYPQVELNLFRETPSKQFIVKKERVGPRTAYLTFMAPNAKIHDLRIKGLPREKLIRQFNLQRDSLELWVNDQRKMPDTLQLVVKYDKTDTTGALIPQEELVKLTYSKELRAELMKKERNYRDRKHEDTIAVMTTQADPTRVEQYGFEIEFKYPLIQDSWDSLKLKAINPRQQESAGKYDIIRDSTNLRMFRVMPRDPFQPGYDYILKIPHRGFRDVNGYYNDSTQLKVTLPNDEKLSSITLELSGVHNRYIVDLLGEKRDKVIRSFIVDADGPLVFPYLKQGSYCLRITEDKNRNALVDTGDLLQHRQPEKVRFFKPDDQVLIKVLERAEMVWKINLEEMFR